MSPSRSLCLPLLALSLLAVTARAQAPAAPASPEPSTTAAEIQATLTDFMKAYNSRDAAALATLFTEDAEIVPPGEDPVTGRDTIKKRFEDDFAALPADVNPQLRLESTSVRAVTPDVAVEHGNLTLAFEKSAKPPRTARYSVVYVKQNGRWLQSLVHEIETTPDSPTDHLEPLAWMVGEWVDESESATVDMTCKWTDNKAYLVREFTVQIQGRPALTGTQRIGYDALTGQIKSWTFDSDGGHSEGLWSHEGDAWVVKSTGVTRDGDPTSATHVITPIGKDSWSWASINRTLGDELAPDIDPLTIVRKAPAPK